jgi:hypothetical protein
LENAQEAVETSKKHLDDVTDVLLNEFEKFKAEKAVDIKSLLSSFAKMQMDYHKKAENIWGTILPQLMPDGDSDYSYNAPKTTSAPSNPFSMPPPPAVPPAPPADDSW